MKIVSHSISCLKMFEDAHALSPCFPRAGPSCLGSMIGPPPSPHPLCRGIPGARCNVNQGQMPHLQCSWEWLKHFLRLALGVCSPSASFGILDMHVDAILITFLCLVDRGGLSNSATSNLGHPRRTWMACSHRRYCRSFSTHFIVDQEFE